jgi:hypothetical protein
LKRGKFDTLATKSGEVMSAGREEGEGAYSELDADDNVGGEMWARINVKIIVIESIVG